MESSAINLSALPANGEIQSLLGSVSTTIAARGTTGGLTLHAWTADSSGLFFTTTDLAAEWQGYYQQVLNGQGGSLTPIERLEANAEAVFENTSLSQFSPAYLAQYRQDAQREFDAIDAAMQINQANYGTDPNAPLTEQTYLQLETTIQSNPMLWELAAQGHGLNNPPAPRYRGYTNDFQNNVDTATLYVGGELNSGRNALTDFFDDNIMTHAPFPTVWQNGQLVQLNQNANRENTLSQAVNAMDESMFYRFYVSGDFKGPYASSTTVSDSSVYPAGARRDDHSEPDVHLAHVGRGQQRRLPDHHRSGRGVAGLLSNHARRQGQLAHAHSAAGRERRGGLRKHRPVQPFGRRPGM